MAGFDKLVEKIVVCDGVGEEGVTRGNGKSEGVEEGEEERVKIKVLEGEGGGVGGKKAEEG